MPRYGKGNNESRLADQKGFSPFVRSSVQEMEIGEAERPLIPMVMALGRAGLEEFVSKEGGGYKREEITNRRGSRLAQAFFSLAERSNVAPLGMEPEIAVCLFCTGYSRTIAVRRTVYCNDDRGSYS